MYISAPLRNLISAFERALEPRDRYAIMICRCSRWQPRSLAFFYARIDGQGSAKSEVNTDDPNFTPSSFLPARTFFCSPSSQNLIFRFLQNKSRIKIWLFNNSDLHVEGQIIVSAALGLHAFIWMVQRSPRASSLDHVFFPCSNALRRRSRIPAWYSVRVRMRASSMRNGAARTRPSHVTTHEIILP